ncbi:MAG TPA: HAD hydrolase family protein [Candidatus Methylomirabilis sp.]|nr:HAD hydrolase family protein [Candidatus Methylomirabilis sp.]
MSRSLRRRAAPIRLLVMDVDGVLTDGTIVCGPDGQEWKAFHVQDGFAITAGQRAGLRMALISGRTSGAVARRAAELGLAEVHQGTRDKVATYEGLLRRHGLTDAVAAFIGDDLVDLPLLRRAGLAVAVADAVPEVRAAAHYVTTAAGGRGAVREVIRLILEAQGRWTEVLHRFDGTRE